MDDNFDIWKRLNLDMPPTLKNEFTSLLTETYNCGYEDGYKIGYEKAVADALKKIEEQK